MKRIFSSFALIFMGLTLLLVGVRVTASQPMSGTALQVFKNELCQPSPCWKGITPGVTTQQEAGSILKVGIRANDLPLSICDGTPQADQRCWQIYVRAWNNNPDEKIATIRVDPVGGDLLLGDIIPLFGEPLTAKLCYINAPTNGDLDDSVPRPLFVGYFTFKGNIKAVTFDLSHPNDRRITPEMTVHRLYFQSGYDINTGWDGFTFQSKLGCNRG